MLAAELAELGRSTATVVASFDDSVVEYFHQIAPEVEVSAGLEVLTAYVLDGTAPPDGMRILQLPPEFSGLQVITPELVARATADGFPIWVWPNDRDLENYDAYLAFLQQGIEGLNINFPAQGVEAVRDFITPGALVAAAPSAGCEASPAAPGEATFNLSVRLEGGYIRHLPPSYDGVTPMPLVLGLHGWSQPPSLLMTQADLGGAADRHRFIAVAPDITRPVPLWDTALDGGDVVWFGALVATLQDELCIDTNRIYVTGMSNGAMMASTLACVLGSRIAAVAPVAGVQSPDGCDPGRPVPLITFHGTDDPYLAFDGGYGPKAAGLPSPDGTGTLGAMGIDDVDDAPPVVDRVATWAGRNGCDGALVSSRVADDVELLSSCEAGATELYVVEGGGHSWPGSEFDAGIADIVGPTTNSIDATELIWEFFREHRCAPARVSGLQPWVAGGAAVPVRRPRPAVQRLAPCSPGCAPGAVLHAQGETGDLGDDRVAMVVPPMHHRATPSGVLDRNDGEPPAGDLHPAGGDVERELAAHIGAGHRAVRLPLPLPESVGTLELGAHGRAGGALAPFAASVLGRPLPHSRQVADQLVDALGAGGDGA